MAQGYGPTGSEKLLRQLQALTLVVGFYLLSIQFIWSFDHVFKNQSSNTLPVIKHERDVMTPNFKNDLTIITFSIL